MDQTWAWLAPVLIIVMAIGPVLVASWLAGPSRWENGAEQSLWTGCGLGIIGGPIVVLAAIFLLTYAVKFAGLTGAHDPTPLQVVAFVAVYWLAGSAWIGTVSGLALTLSRLGRRSQAGVFLLLFGLAGTGIFLHNHPFLGEGARNDHGYAYVIVIADPFLWAIPLIAWGAWLLWRRSTARTDDAALRST